MKSSIQPDRQKIKTYIKTDRNTHPTNQLEIARQTDIYTGMQTVRVRQAARETTDRDN